ncbi:alpha/beta hydrolase [Aurantimonas coralicida]|uniref:alpha/beta hydrolase n=1 Tax=Aurantimonas coralicida TaxID=182270 RepID=UPI001D183A3B|nr:alpha/beta hydrolase [Aurantimonas coralicida]MCC4296661.1 alpha/beta hydrolase [Aurantimonas coralicida]
MPINPRDDVAKNHEWQYNPRVSTPGVESYHAGAAALSDKERRDQPDYMADVPYGSGRDETVDIFPAGSGSPVHLFLHGGYWRGRDKRDYSYLAGPFVRSGITLVVANYSLCPLVSLPDIVEQTKRCLEALPALAEKAGSPHAKLTASGHSAGAHLLACALFGSDPSGPPPGGLAGATLISGLYELEPVLDISVNEEIRLRPDQVASVSPMRMQPRLDVLLDIIAGGSESPGWIAQSALFAERCQKAGTVANFHIETGANHFSIMESYGQEQHYLFKRLQRLAFV